MITCTLSDKQLRILRTKIAKDLLTYVDNKTPFDLKEYLTDMYSRVYGLTGNQNSAIDYARMSIPFIKQLWGVEEKFAELEDLGLDVRELGGLARLVSDDKDGFDETAAFLGVDTNPAVELSKTKEQLNIQEQIEKVQAALALGSSNTVYGVTRKPDSPLSTSIQELIEGNEVNGADPRMKFYTNFTKEILTKLGTEGGKTPEQGVPYKGVDGGLFLTLMRYNELAVSDTYPYVSEVINSGLDRDYIIEDYNNAFIYAITDKQGNIIRFNDKYDVTEDGKVVYYNSRYLPNKNKDNAFDVDRVTNTQNPQEISKNFGISLDEAREYLKQGFEFLESAYDYIRAAKGNKIINSIDFGSFGAVSDSEAKPVPYSGKYFGKQNLNFNFYAPGAVSKNSFGGIYVTPNETNSPVPIINSTLSDELVNNIVSLILDVNEDTNGNIITNADKKKIIGTYVLSSVRDISYGVDSSTGEFFVKVQGEKIKLSNKAKAREELTKALKTNAKGKGREYVIDTAKANSDAVVPMFTISDNKATVTNVPYSEYLGSFASVKVDLDVDGQVKQYNPYFKVAPINADAAKVIVESKDIISDKDYNNFVDKGIVSDIILDIIANKVINKETLSPREMAIFTAKTGEINEIIAKSSKVTSNEAKVAEYRAEEQKELRKAIPNIDNYKVDGQVDRTKLSAEELEAYDKIYDKYDKLITPLLGTKKETYNGIEVVDSSDIKANTGEPGAARYDRTNNKIIINREFLKKKFAEKAWTKSRKQKDGSFAIALAEDAFATYEDFEKFVMEHEYQHSLLTYEQSGATTIGEYEDIINGRALGQKGETVTTTEPSESKPVVPAATEVVVKEANKQQAFRRRRTSADSDILDKLSSDDEFINKHKDKLKIQGNVKATREQIAAALTWYQNSPLSKHIPFKVMFNAINTATKNGIARWDVNGITLFKGSDYSDLYHEAWHGFTQMFLTEAEREKLYAETRRQKGMFVAFSGKTVAFETATDEELEEYLAEDFREYMLGNKKGSVKTPVKKNIFQKIFDFLMELFGKARPEDILTNGGNSSYVNELYEKLRVGDLNQYTFNQANRVFTTLNSTRTVQSTTPQELRDPSKLSYEDSMLIGSTIDALFSQAIDKLSASGTKTFTTSVIRTVAGRSTAYKYAEQKLTESLYNAILDRNDMVAEGYDTQDIDYEIDLLSYALRHFGDPNNLANPTGVIKYHMENSKFLQFEDRQLQELENMDDSKLSLKNEFEAKSGNESSAKALASPTLLYTIRSLYAYDKNGEVRLNKLGFPMLMDYNAAWNRIYNITDGARNVDDVFSMLSAASEDYPMIKQFLQKVGSPATMERTSQELWTEITHIMTMKRIPLVSLHMDLTNQYRQDEENEQEEITPGKSSIETTLTITPVRAGGEYRKVGSKWDNAFAVAPAGEFIVVSKDNVNSLNIPAVMDKHSSLLSKKNLDGVFSFMEDIGMPLEDNTTTRKAMLSAEDGTFKAIYDLHRHLKFGIHKYNNTVGARNPIVITRPSQLFAKYKVSTTDSLLRNMLGGIAPKFTAIQKFQLKWSDDFSDTTVSNAEGENQYEKSLRGTLMNQIDSINRANTITELTQEGVEGATDLSMNHLAKSRNPFMKSSKFMARLFNENGEKYIRKNEYGDIIKAEIELLNMSGSSFETKSVKNIIERSGVAASNADAMTKTLQDFYMMMLYGVSEATRHADKSTTYLYRLVTPNLFSKQIEPLKHLITISDFAQKTPGGQSKGKIQFIKDLTQHLGSEYERIQKVQTEEVAGNALVGNKTYKQVGSEFVIFDKILDTTTKNALKAYGEKGIATQEQFLEELNNDVDLREKVETQIGEYLASQVAEFNAELNKFGFYNNDALVNPLIDKMLGEGEYSNRITPARRQEIIDSLAEAYVANSWEQNLETVLMFYGDPGLYNHAKDEFFKRNAGIGATGGIPRTDQYMQDYINARLSANSFASKLGFTPKKFGKTMMSAVLEDPVTESVYYDDYVKSAKAFTEKRLKDRGASPEQIEKAVNDIVERFGEYKKMTEGDGQGWINFDAYRSLLISLNKWTTTQESIYNKIINGEEVTEDILQFFPVKKMQYWGPLKTDGLPLYGFHKYSLMPLIPNLIKGKNIEKLQNKMLEQGIDYALLKSGSKLNTITSNGKVDKFYNDASSNRDKTLAIEDEGYKFTPNEIFMDYFKDQLEVHDHFNEKVTFSTQLRKLIEDGLMENGVPTDWRPEIKNATERVKAWEEAVNSGQPIDSKNYSKLIKYEANLARLVEIKKDQLRKEIGNNMEDLIKFVKRELTRQELAEHELTFIDYDGQTGELKNSLELSLSVDKIEKLLVGVVQKRLINQKINGEALVQVSGVGFEDANKNMRNATEEEIKKYGTNGLTFYEEILDENKKVIGTRAMKVKISLQGSFKNLLKRDDVLQKAKDEGITPLDALNLLIKDDAWLKDGDNRAMVTMVAARIPVQGLNSMEFMEVFEFLPEESGNIVILPAEIVAKSGGDYDIDKMFTMMPNIKAVVKTVSDKTLEDLSEEMGRKVTRDEIKNVLKMVEFENPLSEDEQAIYDFIENFGTEQTTVSLAKGDNVKGIENALIADSVDILSMPENFINLITPNSTDILKPIASTMADIVRGEKEGTTKSPTEIFELGRNLYKHQANSVGKAVLGIIAVNNTFNTLFARTGLVMDTNRILTTDGKGEPVMMSQELYLPHNEIDKKISLSSAYSEDLSNRVADVINQMINGAVDVAKDAWIFDIQGNKEVIPSLLFLIQAGVPVKQAVYFVSQPIIRDYIELQKQLKSQFAVPAGFKDVGMFYRIEARNSILFDNDQFTAEPGAYLNDKGRYDKSKVFTLLREYSSQPKLFTEKNLQDNMKASRLTGYTDVDKAVFAHFVEIQEMAGQITQLTQALKFDNDKTSTLWDARMKLEKMETVSNGISRESIRKIAEESPISAFKIQDFIIEQYNRLFPLRDSQAMNYTLNYLYAKQKDGLVPIMGMKKKTGMDDETFQRAFRNDLMSFLFQQDYYNFETNPTTYQGKDVTKDVREVTSLTSGVKVKGDTLYVDYTSIKNLYESGAYSNPKQWETTAPVDTTVFDFYDASTGLKLFTKFLFERETLRSYAENSFDALKDTEEFKKYYNSFNTAESEPFRNKKAYEAVLRDKALDNLNYHGHMFYGERAYGRQVLGLKAKHPELFETYPILKNLEAFTKPYGMTTVTNVKFSNTLLTSDDLNVYHSNLQDLANPSVSKVSDPVENQKISNIFQRFALFAMIQTGTDLKTSYSMVRALPTEMTTLLLEKPYNDFINLSVPEQQKVVNQYTDLFVDQYSKDNFLSKKIKNYTGDVSKEKLVLGEGKNRIINLDPLAQIAIETEKTDIEDEGVSRTIEVGGIPINLDALGINFQPNAQQVEALNKMAEFVNKGFDSRAAIEDNMYTLMGYAGTGKTSITKILLEYLNKSGKSVDVTATTHKAKGVLAQAIGKRTKTIHTVLSLAPNIDPARVDLEKLKMSPAKDDDKVIPSDIIIIDESSFIGPDLFQFIKDKADRDEQQVIFIGDPAQIKPVAPNSDSDEVTLKENSPVFKEVSNISELTQVERQATGNPLGPILDSLRNNLFATKDSFAHRTELNGNEGIVFNDSGKAFISAAVDAFRSDNFKANRNFTRIITYVNERVPKYNEAIRKGLGYTEEYVPGEILMGYDNYRRQRNGEYEVNNSVDYVVLSAEYVEDQPIAKNIVGAAGLEPLSGSGYRLVIQDISDKRAKPVEIFMLSKNNEDSLYDALGEQAQKLASLAKTDNSLWKYYYAFKESFGTDRPIKHQGRTVIKKTLDYGYAHTIHKSQGATYTNIFVDLGSISISQDVEERNQMKYVALSRATNIAYALSGNTEGIAPELDWNMDFGKQVPVNGNISSSYKTADDITTLSQVTLVEDPRTGIRTFKYALEKKDGTSQPMTGVLTDETMAAFKLDYPNALILYNETSDGKGGTAGTNTVWRSLGTNSVGLPTKKGTRPAQGDKINLSDALTDETLAENKQLIDQAIANIKTEMAKPNRFIVFDQYGYGQYMIGYPENKPLLKNAKFTPVAKQTFLYLSEQLFRNFGYVNPHYLEFAEGRQVVQKYQPVSDDDLIEQNKIC